MAAGLPIEVVLINYTRKGAPFNNQLALEPLCLGPTSPGRITHYVGTLRARPIAPRVQLPSEPLSAHFECMGMGGVRALGLEGEDLEGVYNAVDYIAELRQSPDLKSLAVGRKVVVIGGGNTAIDIAVQTKRLGAEDVTLVYRRGPEAMSATHHEQEFAQTNGVKIKHWAQPRELRGAGGRITEVIFEYTQLDDSGRLAGTGDTFGLPVDMLFKAIGQTMLALPPSSPQGANGGSELLEMDGERIAVNAQRQTSLSDVWAGGDCVAISEDLTVAAVQDGKLAAEAINASLRG